MGRVGDVVLRAGRVWDCTMDYDLSNITADLMRKADRMDFLCMNVPKCTSCSTYQVQLMNADNQPALWRCRVRKHAFHHEPMSVNIRG